MKKLKKIYLELPSKHKLIIASLSMVLVILFLIPTEKASASKQTSESSLEIGKRYQLEIPTSAQENIQTEQVNINTKTSLKLSPQSDVSWQTATVKSGDSLAKVFKRLGFSARTTHDVANADGEYTKLLKKLNVGDKLKIASNDNGKLISLSYPKSKTEILHVELTEDKYHSSMETKTVEARQAFAHGVINSNFWNAGIGAGLNDNQIISLASIFGWDIDFGQDIRAGDSFHVVFENLFIDGEYIGTGKILAAEFVNRDDPFQAIRFSDGEYYTPDGKSMRKAFLRAPVNFKYISSSFKPKRFHPVQKRWKAHRGIDYAAKTGTPVVAAGNGRVVRAKYDKYNGHHVFIQHGNNIETKYLHFSKRVAKVGQRVKQGDVIGYVGATGLAAGPHLHYEFLLNGVHRNPRTVKLPDAQPIAKKYRADFNKLAALRVNELNGSKHALLAMQATDNTTGE